MLRYLGRYTHRVAISNHRLTAFDGERVTFRWNERVNRILAGYQKVWDFGEDGRLHRVVPGAVTAQLRWHFANWLNPGLLQRLPVLGKR